VLEAFALLKANEARTAHARRDGKEPPRILPEGSPLDAEHQPGRTPRRCWNPDDDASPIGRSRLDHRLVLCEHAVHRRVSRALSGEHEPRLLRFGARRPRGDGRPLLVERRGPVQRVGERNERSEAEDVVRHATEQLADIGGLKVVRWRRGPDREDAVADDEGLVGSKEALFALFAVDDERSRAGTDADVDAALRARDLEVTPRDSAVAEGEVDLPTATDDARRAIDREGRAAVGATGYDEAEGLRRRIPWARGLAHHVAAS
jgi:hypothetical protein